MVGPVLLPTLGLTIIFAIFFFLPEGWTTWLIGLLAAFACFVAGALLALLRSPYLALLALLAPLTLAPLTSSIAGRLRRRLDPPPSRDEFTFRDDSLYPLIGRSGRALTPLRPAGSVDFDGRRLDGLSEGEYIAEGTTVSGLRVRGRYLIVRPLHDPPQHEG
jgi:membrane-bound serine protease (ClpP class)